MEGVFIDKGGAVVNVKHSDFAPSGGIAAQGNGVADDTAALQKAIDYAETQYDATARTGRHVAGRTDYQGIVLYFPPGRYRLTGKLMLKRPLRLLGAGYNESILVTEVNQPALHFEPRVLNPMMNRARVEQLGFEGNYVYRAANTSIAAQDGIYVTKYPDPSTGTDTYANTIIAVHACQFYGLGGAGIHGDFSESATHSVGDKFVIDGCHIERCGSYGIRLDRRHATAYITNNHITANAGGVGLLGTSDFPVASSRILDNIIEANDGGLASAAPGSTAKPFVGVMLTHTNFCEIRGNYFEWHLNAVYAGSGTRNISVVRNYFDGNDVTLPGLHYQATGTLIPRQLSPVHVEADAVAVLIEENDCYIPSRPTGTTTAVWSPLGTWGDVYEVFPNLGGTQHELIRNSARLAGGRRRDASYAAAAVDNVFFESVQGVTEQGSVVQSRERVYRKIVEASEILRLKAGNFEHESAGTQYGVTHAFVYPAGLADAIRASAVLQERASDGTVTHKAHLWQLTDQGFAFPQPGWNGTGTDFGLRRIDFGLAAPGDASFWMRGSLRYNQAPAVAGTAGSRYTILGWRCVADGYPGTWVEMRTPTGT